MAPWSWTFDRIQLSPLSIGREGKCFVWWIWKGGNPFIHQDLVWWLWCTLTIKIHSQPATSSASCCCSSDWLLVRIKDSTIGGIIVRIKNTMYIKLSPFSIYNEAIIAPCQGHSHCYQNDIQREIHWDSHSMGHQTTTPDTIHTKGFAVHSEKCTLWLRSTESFIDKQEFLYYYRINIDFYLEVKKEFYSNPSSPLFDTLLFIQDLLS